MKPAVRVLLLAAILSLSLPCSLAVAGGRGYLSKSEAATEARRQVDGRILSIKLRDKPPAPPEYRVKMLKDGDVYLLHVPASRNGKHHARPGHRR
jgi:uncharacterized membrane protein YkoI